MTLLRTLAGARAYAAEVQKDLWHARRTLRVKQQDLASRLGVATRTLRDWEKAYDNPSLLHLIAWARENGLRLALKRADGLRELPPIELKDGETWEHFELRRITSILRDERRGKALTETDLALLLRVSRSSVQRWEKAEDFPKVELLLLWAARFSYWIVLEPIA